VLGLGAASGSRAHYLVGNEPATKSSSLSFRSCSCRGLPSASTLPVSGGTSARSVWAAQSEKLHQSAALWKGPPELALLGPREMSDLTARWAKASLDQVAVTNRDFVSTRPSQLEIRPPDFCLDCHPNGAGLAAAKARPSGAKLAAVERNVARRGPSRACARMSGWPRRWCAKS
jgi:hypothetical protein